MLVNHQDPFDRPAHSKVLVVVLQPLEARVDRRVFFGLGFFGRKGEIGERVPAGLEDEMNGPGVKGPSDVQGDGRRHGREEGEVQQMPKSNLLRTAHRKAGVQGREAKGRPSAFADFVYNSSRTEREGCCTGERGRKKACRCITAQAGCGITSAVCDAGRRPSGPFAGGSLRPLASSRMKMPAAKTPRERATYRGLVSQESDGGRRRRSCSSTVGDGAGAQFS